jgi:hypothetical protein
MKTIDMDDVNPSDGSEPRRSGPNKDRGGGGAGVPAAKKLVGMGLVALAALALMVLGVSGNLGIVEVEDNQIAVHVNYVTGKKEVDQNPGYKIYLPFIQSVFILDKTPQKYLMERNEMSDYNNAPFLTVRAADGSNFWFESLEIQYALIPGESAAVIEDSGTGEGFKRDWIRAYARSILRDEFGRFSAVEVADPSSYQTARVKSTDRLNEYLNPHGIQILQIITPKPRFDKRYEQAIEERKVADQDVERLKAKEEQLLQEREQQLALVSKEKEIEWQSLQGDLIKAVKEAERESILITKGADRYKITREAQGQQELDRYTAQAAGMVAKYTKEAEGIRARTEALEKKGRVVVREALIEKLSNIEFTLVPYSRDPQPKRLEHSDGSSISERGSLEAKEGGN